MLPVFADDVTCNIQAWFCTPSVLKLFKQTRYVYIRNGSMSALLNVHTTENHRAISKCLNDQRHDNLQVGNCNICWLHDLVGRTWFESESLCQRESMRANACVNANHGGHILDTLSIKYFWVYYFEQKRIVRRVVSADVYESTLCCDVAIITIIAIIAIIYRWYKQHCWSAPTCVNS